MHDHAFFRGLESMFTTRTTRRTMLFIMLIATACTPIRGMDACRVAACLETELSPTALATMTVATMMLLVVVTRCIFKKPAFTSLNATIECARGNF
jgi:hypothetical protein